VLPRTDNAECINRYRGGLFIPKESQIGETVIVEIYPGMPLAQPSLHGKDEENLYPRHPTTKHFVPALDPELLGGVMCCRKVVLHVVRLRMSSRTFGEVNSPRKVFMQRSVVAPRRHVSFLT
jgi:hypothetical protein